MEVKACDRCGEIYPINMDVVYDYAIIKIQPFDGRRPLSLDLCDKCTMELDAFMHPERTAVTVGHGRR